MNLRARFEAVHPGVFFLDPEAPERLVAYLEAAGIFRPRERVRAVTRQDATLNAVVRVVTTDRTVVLKQARPWAERDPSRAVPWGRALQEIAFYEAVAQDPFISRTLPALLLADREARLLVLEDLGAGGDWTGIYRGRTMEESTACALADCLSALHALLLPASVTGRLANRELRALLRAEIFIHPLGEGPEEDPGAAGAPPGTDAGRGLEDGLLRREVARLGSEVYLADGPSLVHGDFVPENLLASPTGPRMVDLEFGFWGRPEIDVGMLLAHLCLGRQPSSRVDAFLAAYQPPSRWDEATALKVAGVELLRRLRGCPPLALGWSPEVRQDLLERGRRLVLDPCPAWLRMA